MTSQAGPYLFDFEMRNKCMKFWVYMPFMIKAWSIVLVDTSTIFTNWHCRPIVGYHALAPCNYHPLPYNLINHLINWFPLIWHSDVAYWLEVHFKSWAKGDQVNGPPRDYKIYFQHLYSFHHIVLREEMGELPYSCLPFFYRLMLEDWPFALLLREVFFWSLPIYFFP